MTSLETSVDMEMSPFIDGVRWRSASDERVDVVNPSNGVASFKIPAGCAADVARAVFSSRKLVQSGAWSSAPPSTRQAILQRFADLVTRDARVLDALDAGEMGKPISETFCSAAAAAQLLHFCASATDKVLGDVYQSDANSFVVQRWVPRGVVGAIVPWNFPTYVALQKVAPALAAGNAVVLKPSELSTRSALKLAELALQAGLPPGAFNVVPGLGATVGRALGLHGDVDMITFTGSTAVGGLMLQYAGQSNMKRVSAECGGKSPQIVFADGVDINAAAASIARAILTNQGQICSVGSRLLVHRDVETPLIDRIVERVGSMKMGDASDPGTTFGPVASSRQCARVMSYIEAAKSSGSEPVIGGNRALLESGGYFVEPTIFRNVPEDAPIAKEEVFGPVLSVIPFSSEEEAIRIANSTIFGLAAYVWTSRLTTAMKMAKAIESSVAIYSAAPIGEGAGYAAAWEPSKQSGVGTEGGIAGIRGYLRRQLVEFYHT